MRWAWLLVSLLLAFAGCVEHARLEPVAPSASHKDHDNPGGGQEPVVHPLLDRARPTEPVHVRLTHDYAMDGPGERTFQMTANPGAVRFHVSFQVWDPAMSCESYGASIRVVRPDGSVYKDVSGGSLVVVGTGNCGSSSTETSNHDWMPGTWRVRFDGTGLTKGIVTADTQ